MRERSGMPNGIAVVLGNGDGTFQSAGTPFPLSFSPGSVEVADLNGDGKLDLVAVDFSGSVAILLGNGDGTFQPAVTYSIGNGLGGMDEAVIADFNTDGKLDIASIASFDTGPAIIYGNGEVCLAHHRVSLFLMLPLLLRETLMEMESPISQRQAWSRIVRRAL